MVGMVGGVRKAELVSGVRRRRGGGRQRRKLMILVLGFGELGERKGRRRRRRLVANLQKRSGGGRMKKVVVEAGEKRVRLAADQGGRRCHLSTQIDAGGGRRVGRRLAVVVRVDVDRQDVDEVVGLLRRRRRLRLQDLGN